MEKTRHLYHLDFATSIVDQLFVNVDFFFVKLRIKKNLTDVHIFFSPIRQYLPWHGWITIHCFVN